MKEMGTTAMQKGYRLNTQEISDLQTYTKSVLGRGYYALTRDFFLSVLNSPARYKVVLRRRCLNLMYLFYAIEWANGSDEVPEDVIDTLYSDSALLANAEEIAKQYCTLKFIPSILIVDDILIHGRTLNRLLDALIDQVYKSVCAQGGETDRETLERAILGALNIRVMVQNGNPLLLHPQYVKRLICEEDRSDIWEPHRWHELSIRISRLIGEGIFQNTSYVFSLYDLAEKGWASATELEHCAQANAFYVDRWNKRNCRNVAVRALTNQAGNIVAFYTLRITQNAVNGKYCAVPFLFCSEMRKVDKLLEAVSTRLKERGLDKVEDAFAYWKGSTRTMAEMIYLIFSHNLLLLFLQDATGNQAVVPDWVQQLDVDKIRFSFRSRMHPDNIRFLDQLACAKEPFFSWDDMGTLLMSATEEAAPLVAKDWIAAGSDREFQPQRYLELILAQRSEMRELDAYYQQTEQEETVDVAEFPSINELYRMVRDIRGDGFLGSKDEIGALVAATLRLMDMGYMSVHSEMRVREGQAGCVCVFREGEQSQCIRVRQYADYLPVLIAMERDCSARPEFIKERVTAFYRELPNEIVEGMKGFIEKLYRSGQRLQDWNISTLQWSEVDETSGESDNEERLIQEMALKTAQRLKELERYQSEFHEG